MSGSPDKPSEVESDKDTPAKPPVKRMDQLSRELWSAKSRGSAAAPINDDFCIIASNPQETKRSKVRKNEKEEVSVLLGAAIIAGLAGGEGKDDDPARKAKEEPDGSAPDRPGNSDPGRDSPQPAEKPIASPQARLQALNQAHDIKGLTEFAGTVEDRTLARNAVEAIAKLRPDNMVEILRDLALSDSYAASPAMLRLVGRGANTEEASIPGKRLQNGDILKLCESGKATVYDILFIMNRAGNAKAASTLLMEQFAPYPELRTELCKALLQTGLFSDWGIDNPQQSPNGISDGQRLQALQYLKEHDPAVYETVLQDLAESEENPFANRAKYELWSRGRTRKGHKQSESAVIEDGRMQDFAERLANERWPDGKDAPKIYQDWLEAKKQSDEAKKGVAPEVQNYLELKLGIGSGQASSQVKQDWANDQKMEEELKENQQLLGRYKAARVLEAKETTLRGSVDEIATGRQKILADYAKRLAKAAGIPEPVLEFNSAMGADDTKNLKHEAGYSPGGGRVLVRESLAMTADRPSAELIASIGHEIIHLEQDNLIVRQLADQLPRGSTTDDLKDMYKKRTGGFTLEDSFLNAVLDMRKGKRLTERQGQRADELMDSFREHNEAIAERLKARELLIKLNDLHTNMTEEKTLADFLGTEPKEWIEKARQLLELKELPPELNRKLDSAACAEEDGAYYAPKSKAIAYRALQEAVQTHLAKTENVTHTKYKARLHEIEADEGTDRGSVYAELAAERLTSAPFAIEIREEPRTGRENLDRAGTERPGGLETSGEDGASLNSLIGIADGADNSKESQAEIVIDVKDGRILASRAGEQARVEQTELTERINRILEANLRAAHETGDREKIASIEAEQQRLAQHPQEYLDKLTKVVEASRAKAQGEWRGLELGKAVKAAGTAASFFIILNALTPE